MRSEKSRERDVYKYYQSWLESTAGFDASIHNAASSRYHPDGSILRASNDKALIAFAQLGCLRLNVKRGVVTLIGSTRQYVLAEATKSLSLISNLTDDDDHDELWFGNASLPRSQGISEAALDPPTYTAFGRHGKQHTAQALVISDLTQHERYSKYAVAGHGVTFYCGVPIISKAGYPIGVYTVTDDKPRDALTASELIFMQDMSRIVMRHLETVKNDTARSRGEKMILGLSDFMRGKSSTQRPTDIPLNSPILDVNQYRIQSINESDVTRQFKGMTITNADPDILRNFDLLEGSIVSVSSQNKSHIQPSDKHSGQTDFSQRSEDSSAETKTNVKSTAQEGILPQPQISKPLEISEPSISQKIEQIFSRAATILRECAAADGVVFYDAGSLNLETGSHTAETKAYQNQIMESSGTSEDSASDSHDYFSSGSSTDSDASCEGRSQILKSKGRKCDMLGYDLDVSSTSSATVNTIKNLGLTERSLRHFVRRYPRGKAFYFDATGDLIVSDTEKSDDSTSTRSKSSHVSKLDKAFKSRSKSQLTKAIAEALIRIVPGARNVVWLPLWDFYKQRWCAGMFLWSRRPDRLLTAQDDMAYFKTFGNSIMIELSRIDAQFADEAKSTFIANISHELRSPLHGVMGSVEFLKETTLDDFQSSMAHNIETCAKTLLDTVEHVLDYAKINQWSAKFARRSESQGLNIGMAGSALERDIDLAELIENTVEAVYAASIFRAPGRTKVAFPTAESPNLTDKTMQMTREKVKNNSKKVSGTVRVLLNIEKELSWWVRTQPGAISRIILNILGNALKYTDDGHVEISLAANNPKSEAPSKRSVCMTVKDTGRGISASFLRNHAFVPFNQESQFSEGVGLGLSIVRQIVRSFAGHIELTSTQGVGTEIKITMSLPMAVNPPSGSDADSILSTVIEKTSGMTICFLDPKLEDRSSTGRNASDEAVQRSISELAQTWFGMKTVKSASMEGVKADFFFYAEPPPIDYLLHHHGRHSRDTKVPLIILTPNPFESANLTTNGIHDLTDLGRALEVISQPCGPHKLAAALHRCLMKLNALMNDPESNSTTDPVRPQVHGSAKAASTLSRSQGPDKNDSHTAQIESSQVGLERKLSSEDDRSQARLTSQRRGSLKSDPGTNQTPSLTASRITLARTSSYDPNPVSASEDDGNTRSPVLLVDDNDINLKLLVAFMKMAQHPYVTATDGLQAFQAYEKASVDPETALKYVLMDISMPVMDGIESTKMIRRYERKTGIKEPATIITLTGLSMESTRKDMMEAGADYFLSKPVKFKDLIQLMRP